MELNNLQIIDWEAATTLAGGKREFAEELLNTLMKTLNQDIALIQQLHEQKNYKDLLAKVHRLHGALCYCGLPRLKMLVSTIEAALKNNKIEGIAPLIKQLESEVNLLLK